MGSPLLGITRHSRPLWTRTLTHDATPFLQYRMHSAHTLHLFFYFSSVCTPPPMLKLTGLGSMEGRVGAMLSTIDLGASGSYIARFHWAPLMGRVH